MLDTAGSELLAMSHYLEQTESRIVIVVGWLRLIVEIMGATVIAIGVAVAVVGFFRTIPGRDSESFYHVRLTLARYLALALEFQLAADILATAIAPTWDQIGKLGAIAVIRTGLNYFLMREMAQAKREEQEEATKVAK